MVIDVPATEQPDFGEGRLYFVGNATTVIGYGGFSILTDPAFLHAGEHVHLGHGAYARREVEPACQISELPPLDLVVLSHHHGDHFDDVAARELDKSLPIITNDHAVGLLHEQGFTQGHALDTWQSQEVTKGGARLQVTSMPGKHAPDHVAGLLPPVMVACWTSTTVTITGSASTSAGTRCCTTGCTTSPAGIPTSTWR